MHTELAMMQKHHTDLEMACTQMEEAATKFEALHDQCTAEHSVECAAYTLMEELVDCVAALCRSQVADSKVLHMHLAHAHQAK